MHGTSSRNLHRICRAFVAATALTLAADASALNPQDMNDCESSADVPRMIAACTNLARDVSLPAGLRSMALLKRGFGNFALGHLDAAEGDFSEAVTLNPKNNYAHHELGLTLFKKGEPDRAIVSLTEAIRLDPTGAASRVSRGQVYMSEDRLDDAIRDFTDAIKLGADKNTAFTRDQQVDRPEANRVAADYYAARAGAYYLKGNFSDAASDYHNAAGLSDPDGYNVIWETVARSRAGSAGANTALSAALDRGQLND